MKAFNTSLLTGRAEDHQNLAIRIAAAMKADTSQPNPEAKLRDGWDSDVQLRALEQYVGNHGLWAEYADVCLRLVVLLAGDTEARLLAEVLGWVCAVRRIDGYPAGEIRKAVDRTDAEIDALDQTVLRVERLRDIWDYQGAMFADTCGDYELAQILFERGAEAARQAGNLETAAINTFRAVFSRFNRALQGEDGAVQREHGERVFAGRRQLLLALEDTETQQHWIRNALLHCIEVWLCTGQSYPELEDDLEWLKSYEGEESNLLKPYVEVAEARVFLTQGDTSEAMIRLERVTDGQMKPKPHAEIMVLALNLKAGIQLSWGRRKQAKQTLRHAVSTEGVGAHQFRAVVMSQLESIEAIEAQESTATEDDGESDDPSARPEQARAPPVLFLDQLRSSKTTASQTVRGLVPLPHQCSKAYSG